MKAQYDKDGRVIISLTQREWKQLQAAFSFIQSDAEADRNNEFTQEAANITYQIEKTVRASRTQRME